MTSLFDPIQVGDIALANRIVMAPLTRNRAIAGNVAGPLTVEYYRQRATAGLIIAEASQISPMAQGYLDTPGIYSPEQIAGWRQVTAAVHAAGGKIVDRQGRGCLDLYQRRFRPGVEATRPARR